jgi:hypothetical protein
MRGLAARVQRVRCASMGKSKPKQCPHVRVHVTPIYGYGWSPGAQQPEMAVPGEFSFEATIFEDGHPFKGAFGLVSEPNHPLTGLWVVLWQRTHSGQPTYSLSAFSEKPDDPARPTIAPRLTGFCVCTIPAKTNKLTVPQTHQTLLKP